MLDDATFEAVSDLVYRQARIVIRPEKRSMLQGRLVKRMNALGISNFADYASLLASSAGEKELPDLLNAVTTNVTSFFREPHHFDHLQSIALAEILSVAGDDRRARIWSAGCSTGQEPYSIAMVMAAALRNHPGIDARILATDIDTKVLAQAEAATYPAEQIEQIPAKWRGSCELGADAPTGRIRPAIASLVTFKQLNLVANWPMSGPFNAVFCRNVVIYFDKETQRTLFDRIANMLAPEGWLYIGHSESLFNVCDRFELVGRTTYRKRR